MSRLDAPGTVAAAAAALAENAWITRHPDHRLDEPLVTDLFTRAYAGSHQLKAGPNRLRDASAARSLCPGKELRRNADGDFLHGIHDRKNTIAVTSIRYGECR